MAIPSRFSELVSPSDGNAGGPPSANGGPAYSDREYLGVQPGLVDPEDQPRQQAPVDRAGQLAVGGSKR